MNLRKQRCNPLFKPLWVTVLFVMPLLAAAQGEASDVHINVDDAVGAWYTNPVVWLVAASAFVLLLVIVLRGKRPPRV